VRDYVGIYLGIWLVVINVVATVFVFKKESSVPRPLLLIGIWMLPVLGALLAFIAVAKEGTDDDGPTQPGVPWL
jgi:hypothetical protein